MKTVPPPIDSDAAALKVVSQVKGASEWGLAGGLAVSGASLLIFFLTLVQAIFLTPGWSSRLALVVEGLIWSSLIGAAGALLIVLSQALRCLFDLTYRSVRPLESGS